MNMQDPTLGHLVEKRKDIRGLNGSNVVKEAMRWMVMGIQESLDGNVTFEPFTVP